MKRYTLNEPTGGIETHIDFRGNLNDQQYEVVTKADGPCLVLAGAGSGKTRTLIYRLAYLLERGVPPENILLMTFTNKAAREMRERTEMLLRYSPRGLWSGTFHHIGNRSIRMYASSIGYDPNFGILDEHDSRDLVKTCVKKISKGTDDGRFPKASVVRSIISLSVNTGTSLEDLLDERYPYFSELSGEIRRVKDLYEEKKKESGNMDYDDLLIKWKYLLENVPEARERFSRQFRYLMIDEYQDTNFIQADIVNILGEHHGNILVVGDDAQSIYSFRGARVENILKFPDRSPGAKVFRLETNYRSTPDILSLANNSLANNRRQFEKSLKAVNPALETPALVKVKDAHSQARFITQRILELKGEGKELKDIAVLFRAHYQSAELEMELVKKNIPYIVRGGIRFFEQAHIKDVLSYMKILVNPLDEIAWVRALTLCPGIGPGYAGKIYGAFKKSGRDLMPFVRSHDISGAVPLKAREGYKIFQRIMRTITIPGAEDVPGQLIKTILEEGYKDRLIVAFDNAKDRIDDIHELVNFSHEYGDLKEFLNDITLRENFKGETADAGSCEDQLVLSTIHQAKGLEWDAVMVIGLCEGQFPHPKAMGEDAEMEEERRLFYVAVTRAKKMLYMIHPGSRYDHSQGTVPSRRSRFLEELDDNVYEIWEVDSPSPFFSRSAYPRYSDIDRDEERYSGSGDFKDMVVDLD